MSLPVLVLWTMVQVKLYTNITFNTTSIMFNLMYEFYNRLLLWMLKCLIKNVLYRYFYMYIIIFILQKFALKTQCFQIIHKILIVGNLNSIYE